MFPPDEFVMYEVTEKKMRALASAFSFFAFLIDPNIDEEDLYDMLTDAFYQAEGQISVGLLREMSIMAKSTVFDPDTDTWQ